MLETIPYKLRLAEHEVMETLRCKLRPVTLDDAEAMFAYASDEATTKFLSFPPHESVESTRKNIADYFMSDPLGKWGIVWKENQQMIGTIDLHLNEAQQSGEMGYAIHCDYWGRGIVAEVASRLLALSFEELKLVRVFAMHDVKNPNSGRVMEKIGMEKVGVIKNGSLIQGHQVDDALYNITRDQYQTLMK